MRYPLLVLAFLSTLNASFGVTTQAPVCEPYSGSIKKELHLVAALQYLLPNQLPDFIDPVFAYGAGVGIPIGGDFIDVQGLYGTAEGVSLILTEANYRFLLNTPLFTAFLLAGGHYLRYSSPATHDGFGGTAGFGFLIPLSGGLEITVGAKGYIESRTVLSFGGSFAFAI